MQQSRYAWLALVTFGVIICVACTDRRPSSGASRDDTGPPIRGGTLEIVGSSDLDHWATTSGYTTRSNLLLQTFARQLLAYRSSGSDDSKIQPVADLAIEVPTHANGGISGDSRTYTFHLRRGVRWDTHPPRDVNAHDVVRAFKLFCNPVSPVGAPIYYTSTIAGMAEYCDAFNRVPGAVGDIRTFVTTHEIEGVRASDDFTIVFRLSEPAPDFLNLVAMIFASPVPVEYLDSLPDSPEFRQHITSNGPYRVAHYVQNREMLLERNPVWDPATDSVRTANIDRIHLRLGFHTAMQQLQIQAGTADVAIDPVPTAELASLLAIHDPSLLLASPAGVYFDFTFLSINRVGPPDRGALNLLDVRRAIARAVDKAALVRLFGGPTVARTARQAVPTGMIGFRAAADHDVTPGDHGDPAAARRLLTEAGYPNGLSLRLACTTGSILVAEALQESLGRAGIAVQISQYSFGDYMGRLLANPDNARRGEWDLAVVDWGPDWFGNNGRSFLLPLVDSRNFGQNGSNYGGYRSADVDALMRRATTSPDTDRSERLWFEAAQRLLDDAAFVPLTESLNAYARSRRVRGCQWAPLGLNCNLNALWLADAKAEPKRAR